jgi:hypothetical protein
MCDAVIVSAVGEFQQAIKQPARVAVFWLLREFARDRQPFRLVLVEGLERYFEESGKLTQLVSRKVRLEDWD